MCGVGCEVRGVKNAEAVGRPQDKGPKRPYFVEFGHSPGNSGLLRPYFWEKRAETRFWAPPQRNKAVFDRYFPRGA
ncbi:hypothetical protein J25TS5_40190 [Paenibacillus faecis]|nr:hypothetical protein J25TS5_40190 [Paenibacillus faecis]